MESKGLDIKTVDDLTTDKYVFKIPFYQRGYRWSADDAELLAKDIETYDGHYFLQPIIVRKIGDKNYELVDGQQRLTTLNLILEASKSERRFVLEYERDPALSSFDKLYHDEVKKRLSNISFSLDIKDKLLSTYFVFFDMDQPLPLFFAEYIGMMGLWAVLAYYAGKLLRRSGLKQIKKD